MTVSLLSLRNKTHMNFTSLHNHRQISSACSFVIINVDGGLSGPVCPSSDSMFDTKKNGCVWAQSTPMLFTAAFILLFWHKIWEEERYVAPLSLWCSSEFGLISILVPIHNPACVSGDPMSRWSTMGRFPARAGEEGHCRGNLDSSDLYHLNRDYKNNKTMKPIWQQTWSLPTPVHPSSLLNLALIWAILGLRAIPSRAGKGQDTSMHTERQWEGSMLQTVPPVWSNHGYGN